MLKKILYFSILLISLSCRTDDSLVKSIKKIDIDNIVEMGEQAITINEVFSLSQTNEPIAGVNKVVYADNKYFIHDRKFSNLYCFDSSGKYINKIGKLGGNLGEYQDIWDFELDSVGKEINILSNGKRAFVKYKYSGEYLSDKQLPLYAYSFLVEKNKYLFFCNQYISEFAGNNNLILTNDKLELIEKLSIFPVEFNSIISYSGFLIKSNTQILYSAPFDETVYSFNLNERKLNSKYQIVTKNKVPEDFRKKFNKYEKEIFNYNFLMTPFLETKSNILLKINKDGKPTRIYFNLRNQQTYSFNNDKDKLLLNLIGTIVGTKENTYVGIIYPEDVLNMIEETPKKIEEIQNIDKRLHKILKEIKIDSNPILLFFSIK